MSSAQGQAASPRPQEVTIGGLLAISGSVVALVSLVTSMNNLYSSEMTDVLRDVMDGPGVASMSLSIDDMRRLAKTMIMVLAVLSVTSGVLGVFVLRRDRIARIVLTCLGSFVAVLALLSGFAGLVLTVYIAVSLGLLWSRPARAWFRPAPDPTSLPPTLGGPPPGDGPPGPPGPPGPGRQPPPVPPPGWRPPPQGWRPPAGPPPGWRPPPPPPGWRPPPGPPPGWRPPPPASGRPSGPAPTPTPPADDGGGQPGPPD